MSESSPLRLPYVRKGSLIQLERTSKMILDCDGVVVYVNKSYREAIRTTVDHYFLRLVGLDGHGGALVSEDDVQALKDTGAYNNDWSLSHTLIIYYLSIVLMELRAAGAVADLDKLKVDLPLSHLDELVDKIGKLGDLCIRHGIDVGKLMRRKTEGSQRLERFLANASKASYSSPTSLLVLRDFCPEISEHAEMIQQLIPYNTGDDDLLTRLFEEIYLGAELFERFYRRPPIFDIDEGYFHRETIIPRKETLELLVDRWGKLGIYSERPRTQGIYLLETNGIDHYFDRKTLFFLDDLEELERRRFLRTGGKSNYGKPNPDPLVWMSQNHGCLCYVGDTVSDAVLVKNARAVGAENIVFVGTLLSSRDPKRLLAKYIELGADIILRDLNEVPSLISEFGGSDQ